jgi:hypothetical protein
LVWPDGLGPWVKPETWPDHAAFAQALAVFERLDALRPAELGVQQGEHDRLPWVRFDAEGQAVFDAWRRDLENRLRGGDLASMPAYETSVAKQRSLMPSLALLLKLAESAAEPACLADGIPARSAKRAAALVEFFDVHQRKVYARELRPGLAGAHCLLQRIRAGEVADRETVRDVYRRGWSGLTTAEAAAAAIAVLERHGWVRVERSTPGHSGGRPSEVLRVHPTLRRPE